VFRADADRQSTIAAAQADAEKARLSGEGERARRSALADAEAIEGAKKGEAEKLRRQAIAEAVEREGAADASAILARGKAEAEAMDQRSQAFSTYGEAAVLDLLVKVLPDIVNAAAAPLAAVDKITMITSDGGTGGLAKSVASNVAQGLQLTNDLTGVDLAAMLSRLGGSSAAATADEAPVGAKPSNGGPGRPQRITVDGDVKGR
jgi:flotillin